MCRPASHPKRGRDIFVARILTGESRGTLIGYFTHVDCHNGVCLQHPSGLNERSKVVVVAAFVTFRCLEARFVEPSMLFL